MSDSKELFAKVSGVSTENEFYLADAAGYKPGKTKYVIVFGTVMSGLGKGIFSSSLAKCMQDKGLTVAPIKLEGYLNVDSGTLNPYRHGEVFVLDDGMETDMDLGTYERLLDQNLTRLNFTTSGQIFTRVLEKERKGSYLGRDVQMIPHVTGEVKTRLRELAVTADADVVFVEIGGTVGDVENAYYIEAMRELAFEEGPNSVLLRGPDVHPRAGDARRAEVQGRPARHQAACWPAGSSRTSSPAAARSPITERSARRLAVYSNVPHRSVFSHARLREHLPDPRHAARGGPGRGADRDPRASRTASTPSTSGSVAGRSGATSSSGSGRRRARSRIGIMGKYTSVRDSYASIIHALEHARLRRGLPRRDRVDRHDRHHRRQRGRAPGRRCTASSCPAGSASAGRRARSPASATPARTSCRTWASATASRWR